MTGRESATLLVGLATYTAVIVGGTWLVKRLCLPTDTVATAGNVAIALTGLIIFWYTLETSRLRRQNAEQTAAAREQAQVTRQIFEASQRPFLEITWIVYSFIKDRDRFNLRWSVKNHGPVPAVLKGWAVKATLNGDTVVEHERKEVTQALFAGDDRDFEWMKAAEGAIEGAWPDFNVCVIVEYESPSGRSYSSQIDVTGRWGQWTVNRRKF